jgi:transposase
MRIIRQVLRLANTDKSQREIAKNLNISRQTVSSYINRAKVAGLSWPLPDFLDDGELEIRLFPMTQLRNNKKFPDPDWESIHKELQIKGATKKVLYYEYLSNNTNGMSYSLFCERYLAFRKTKKIYMRQSYPAGGYVFVDYAGKTLPIINKDTGEEKKAQVFVAVLGYSNLIYVEVHWSQELPNWIAATIRMLRFFGGSPKVIVCDNLKSAVTKASKNNPIVNYTYLEMAEHYGIDIIPARPYKPKDKAKAENGVLHIQRQILFVLRNNTFYNLGEANEKIKELVDKINKKPFSKLEGSRWQRFIDVEKDVLLPLPISDYQFAEYYKVRVGLDYHISFDKSSYSAPYYLAQQIVELRVTTTVVEILNKGKRIASHIRSYYAKVITDSTHMPPNHKAIKDFNIESELQIFSEKGYYIHEFTKNALCKLKNKRFGYRICNSIKALINEYNADDLNEACQYAIKLSITNINTLTHVLKHDLHKQSALERKNSSAEYDIDHSNIRGSEYYK